MPQDPPSDGPSPDESRADVPFAGEPPADLVALAGELRGALGRAIRRLRLEYRFGHTQASVLGRLDRQGPQSTGELARAERVRPQSMSQTLAELEAEGLVSRAQDEQDGRRTLVSLTETGRDGLNRDRAVRDGWLARALADEFTADERAQLLRAIALLERISDRP